MRAIDTTPVGKLSVARRSGSDFQRTFLICGIALAFGLVVAAVASLLQPTVSQEARPRAASEAPLSTGSMLFVAPSGNQCRQATIDNDTWRIRSGGPVDCDEALARAANAGNDVRTPGSRLELIRRGFRGER